MKTEPIAQILTAMGVVLTFTYDTLNGIPLFDEKILYGETTVAQATGREFNFSCSTSELAEKEIAVGNSFTITDDTYVYEFDIDDIQPDMTGWSTVYCSYVGRTDA